jgi:AmmeMemoRadiSam system protein A
MPSYRYPLWMWGLAVVVSFALDLQAMAGKEKDMLLSPQEKQTLHEIARQAIASGLSGKNLPALDKKSPNLAKKRGAFVTLHHRGQLRGCIGLIEPIKPLAEAIQEMAVSAAFKDPRFPPLRADELPEIQIEISVLSPLTRVKEAEDIEVGKHGIYLEKGFNRGLLLPQVATEYKWDRHTFLRQTCQKAGLNPEAWKDPDTRLYIFSAEIF